jgi:hypothetical protein
MIKSAKLSITSGFFRLSGAAMEVVGVETWELLQPNIRSWLATPIFQLPLDRTLAAIVDLRYA